MRVQSRGEEKKAYPIPVGKDKLPYDNILAKVVVEKNNLPQVVMGLGQLNNVLQKGATQGNDTAGKLQVPNKGLHVP